MKNRKRILYAAVVLLFFFTLNVQAQQTLKIASWNIQTFFDCIPTGNEYSGFTARDKGWTEEKYRDRLKKLCDVIEILDADVVVLEEIENSGIIYDIINFYSEQGRRDKAYTASCFAGESGQAFGVAILSRYEILDYSQHSLDIRCEDERMPYMRPLLRARISCGGKTLTVFANHWKSKVSGEDEGQKWRDYQQAQLSSLCKKEIERGLSNAVVCCGDFNQDLSEFTIKMQSDGKRKVKVSNDLALNSCWLNFNSTADTDLSYGSYYYQGEWSKIDNIFYDDRVMMVGFSAVRNEKNVTEEGIPDRYSVWSGSGTSDHLPLCATIRF